MNTTIGIYKNHELAVAAVQTLKDANFPLDLLTIMGKDETEAIDEEMHIIPKNPVDKIGLATGTAIGTTLGILTGVGVFAIPGVGFLYGAGALVGAIAGFDFGLMGGGLASVLATIGVKDENAKKYEQALIQGKFLLIVHGSEQDVNVAKAVLRSAPTITELTDN
jgi:hypothetical protein